MSTAPAAEPVPFKKSVGREYLESVVVAVILALFIRTFVVQAFKIPTGSMETNLLIGDHLLVNKLVYSPSLAPLEDTLLGKKPIQRGHVVVFKFPEDPHARLHQAGDRPAGRDGRDPQQERLHRRQAAGRAATSHFLEPPSAAAATPSTGCAARGCATTGARRWCPAGKLFVLGDNRDNSRDSRFWGFLPRDQVKGRALLVYWSYEASREEYHRTGYADWVRTPWPPSGRPAGSGSST